MQKIKIGVAHWGAGLAPVFAAVEGGYLAEQGLDPELVFIPGHSNALHALIAGEVDFINSVGPEVILANHREGGDAAIIASAIGRSAQVVSARPGITGGREALRGLRWGITARHEADECSILMALDRWGWDIGRDVEIVVVGAGPRLDVLLDAGRVDVAIMHAPEQFQAEGRGWNIIEDLGRLDVAFQNSCAATTRRTLRDRADLVQAYVRAYCAAVWRFRTDGRFGAELLHKYTRDRNPLVIGQTWTLFARSMGGLMFPSTEGVRNAGRVLHRLGAIPAAPPPEASIDLRPVAALERAGFFDELMGLPQEWRG